MITAAMLKLIEESGECAMVLTDGVDHDELMRSRITRYEVERLLVLVARTLDDLAVEARQLMPEIDWPGWEMLRARLNDESTRDEALWFGLRSLLPATLSWLRVYRKSHPELFSFVP